MKTSPPTALNSSKNTRIVRVGGVDIGGSAFSVIAGPCSIESEEQFRTVAQHVARHGACLLRGGIWKMRTSVKSFQGVGTKSFEYVRDICRQTNMGLVSEVADIKQVEEVYDLVDMFQVGARNMHNYSLLKELGRQKKPVLLKRSFAALIEEWIQAAEYVTAGGNSNVVLCERGIRTFETATRNTLDLNAVVFAKKNTDLPVIVDPSHAVGISELVTPLALAAAACGADGVIVEVHPNPSEALSDGMQALTLEGFSEMSHKIEKVLNALDRPLQKVTSL